ncbi:MAG: hypothetical protein IKM58_01360 [Tidjanibacter sp.]|nr:hypothetical protein [Tidjanibacter sp.]
MKNFKKIATFCCGLMIAMSALILTSCNNDDEPSNKEILTSSQWINTTEDMPVILDIDYSSKGNLLCIMTSPMGNLKQTIPIRSFTEGDFNGYEFKIMTSSSMFSEVLIKVNDESSITISIKDSSITFNRVESKLDVSSMPEVDFEELM